MNLRDVLAPIFVVGVPRSGTTLLTAMLAAHSHLSCGTETRFFRFLGKTDQAKLIDSKTWPDPAVEYLYSINLVDIPIPEHYGFTREQIRAYLEQKPPSIPTILSSLTEQLMDRNGKQRWIEKSPEHTLHVREIRGFFPYSPIIRIIRDPRDVALSLIETPWGLNDFLEGIFLWRMYDEASANFFQEDTNSFTIYYHALLQSPEAEIRKLCDFIKEPFEDQILDTSESASNLVTKKDEWHRIVSDPIDTSRIDVWRRELSKLENQKAEALIGDRLNSYGFDCTERFELFAIVFPSIEDLLIYKPFLALLVDHKIRFWQESSNENNHFTIYIGYPDKGNWLFHKKPKRWWEILRIILQLLKDKLNGTQVLWIRNEIPTEELGYSERLVAIIIKLVEISQFDLYSAEQ